MAEKLKKYDFRKAGHPGKYPWDEWSNGKPWKITKGVDFDCSTESMQVMVRRQASSAGVGVTVNVEGDDVIFQFGNK